MKFSDIIHLLNAQDANLVKDEAINRLVTDTRSSEFFNNALFFPINTSKRDGHRFIPQAYHKGIRNFLVEDSKELEAFSDVNYCIVENTLEAMQKIAAYVRSKSDIKLIAITGSNGKTIVKEWLSQILSGSFRIVKSPKSYNSQIGVPLSVWQINDRHNLGIFEAGISQEGEMQKLQKILQPDIGILTNIGSAHDDGFESRDSKLREKLKLFEGAERLILREKELRKIKDLRIDLKVRKFISWGESASNDYQIEIEKGDISTIKINGNSYAVHFADEANLENVCHCIVMSLELGLNPETIRERLEQLPKIKMRLEVKEAENNCILIDDTYNHDEAGLLAALDFLSGRYASMDKSVIISDLPQSGMDSEEQLIYFKRLFKDIQLKHKILISESIEVNQMDSSFHHFKTVEDFLKNIPEFDSELVLISGSRNLHFEQIVRKMEKKIHGTRLEINLSNMSHNLNYFRTLLDPKTKMMVMVKAFAYGAGSREVANLLEFNQVDYLGVAYASEGVELRKLGLTLPIFVMNPSPESLSDCFEYRLEPEVYNFSSLLKVVEESSLRNSKIPIHINIDTGMKRLGFDMSELKKLGDILNKEKLKVASIFSHLASSDDITEKSFNQEQFELFDRAYEELSQIIKEKPLKHILNSAGILNYPDKQFDMVRLGIGLYGINNAGLEKNPLLPIGQLVSEISQIKNVSKGQTIGYSRKGRLSEDGKIATIPIGYADGFQRIFSNGKGKVCIKNKLVPVIGNVCMDMIMVDVSGMEVEEGNEVIIFGENPKVEDLAAWAETIPYEILTNVSERVKRIYITD